MLETKWEEGQSGLEEGQRDWNTEGGKLQSTVSMNELERVELYGGGYHCRWMTQRRLLNKLVLTNRKEFGIFPSSGLFTVVACWSRFLCSWEISRAAYRRHGYSLARLGTWVFHDPGVNLISDLSPQARLIVLGTGTAMSTPLCMYGTSSMQGDSCKTSKRSITHVPLATHSLATACYGHPSAAPPNHVYSEQLS